MRQRSQTIGALGRAPARQAAPAPAVPPPSAPDPVPESRWRRWLRGALLENTALKFLSLVLAITVFLLVSTDEDREITVRVGVKYDYPPDKVLVSEPLEDVRATIRGPWRRLRGFDERELDPIRLDLHTAPTGEIAITPNMIDDLPPGLEAVSVSPRAVRVAFDKKIEKLVEVEPVVTGQPPHGFRIEPGGIKAIPPTITVRGAEQVLAALSTVRTSEVDLASHPESFEELASIIAPQGVTVDPQQKIRVEVRFELELVTRKLRDLPVVVAGDGVDPKRWQLSPAKVDVTLTGPLLEIEAARKTMVAHAVLASGDARRRDVKVVIEGIKEGLGVKVSPERVTARPVKPDGPPGDPR